MSISNTVGEWMRRSPGAVIRTGRRSRSGRGRAGSIRGAEAMRDAARRRCGPGKGADRTGRRRTARSGPRGARRARRSGAHAAKPQPAEASRPGRCAAKQASNPWLAVANAGGTARRGCHRGWDREREEAKAACTPPSRRAPRDRREGATARGPAFAIPATVARAGRSTSRARAPTLRPGAGRRKSGECPGRAFPLPCGAGRGILRPPHATSRVGAFRPAPTERTPPRWNRRTRDAP